MMRLIFLDPALVDIEGILDFISKQNPQAAIRFGEELIDTCHLLSKNPELGAMCDDLATGIRQFTFRGYGIYYRIDQLGGAIRIGRVLHPSLNVGQQSFD